MFGALPDAQFYASPGGASPESTFSRLAAYRGFLEGFDGDGRGGGGNGIYYIDFARFMQRIAVLEPIHPVAQFAFGCVR